MVRIRTTSESRRARMTASTACMSDTMGANSSEKFKTDPDADGRPPEAAAKSQIILSASHSGEFRGRRSIAGADGPGDGRAGPTRGLAAARSARHRLDGPRLPLAAPGRARLARGRPPHRAHPPG